MRFVKSLLLIAIFLIGLSPLNAQNSTPAISNISALADTIFHKLEVTFDVSDAENDSMEIFLSASSNNGYTFALNTSNATGDIGFPVMQGTAKHIEWYYPDSLSGMLADFKIKLAADDRMVPSIRQLIEQIDSNRLKQNIQLIEGIRHRVTGAQHLQEVRDTLLQVFQQHGLQSRIHSFPYGSYTGKNIIGKKTGAIKDAKVFIMDGHYDTVNDSPGADDNGSAIAAILEVLRIVAPLQLQNSVAFIAFDLEEAGLSGSEAFVANGIMDNENIEGVINMDMIAYYSEVPNSQTIPAGFDLVFPDLYAQVVADSFRANFIINSGNTVSRSMLDLFDSMATQYVPDLLVGSIEIPGNGEFIPDARRSDHVAFWDAGYKALHISDGANTRNPNYHSPSDVDSTLNYHFMYRVTQVAMATLLSLVHPVHAGVKVSPVMPDPGSAIGEVDGCNILLAPNPLRGYLRVSTENCSDLSTIRIFTIEGKMVLEKNITSGGWHAIDLGSNVESGYYLVELSNAQHSYSRKILVR